jgi:hypothetical protein
MGETMGKLHAHGPTHFKNTGKKEITPRHTASRELLPGPSPMEG